MANDYFKFKNFTIYQDRCAMKVTTLACIQGAWTPNINSQNVLDIGAGTGLLSHMLAQKWNCLIDAVEVEEDAADQLNENIVKNSWKNKINCHHESIVEFAKQTSKKYDFIISNPPFFSKQKKSPYKKINIARHEDSLTIESLLDVCNTLLANQGKVSILLPPMESKILAKNCEKFSLSITDQLQIYDSPNKPEKATVSILSRLQRRFNPKTLTIKTNSGSYSQEFITLLKDYYLYF